MRIAATVLCLFVCIQTWAKTPKDAQYQDATLVGFKDVSAGSSCTSSGNVKATTNENGDTTGSTSGQADCSNKVVRQYTVQVGSHTYVLVYGYNFLNLHNDLYKQFPGAHFRVRFDKRGIYVWAGKKEALYDIVEAK